METNETISVKLPVFEGPLDLLLRLIDINKVSIYDIPIVEITDQYLTYINKMDRIDLNSMSEFLLMAATLLDIKSKMLLPAEKNEEGEEEDPRAELVNQLLEYKLYKRAAEELREREEETGQAFCKKPTIPREVAAYAPEIDTDALLKDVTLSGLYKVFQDITRRSVEKIDPIRSRFGKIEKEEVNLAERIEYVRQYAKERGHFSFRQLLEENCGKTRIIVTFLAILELMKRGELRISQEKTFAEIEIEAA